MKKILLLIGFLALVLLSPGLGWVEEAKDREPLGLEQMEEYKSIPFTVETFEKISDGMSEREVLSALGKPESVQKQPRKGYGRWSSHYLYPGGYVVNFRNGQVVGKEKKE
jgi:hypothetical protein